MKVFHAINIFQGFHQKPCSLVLAYDVLKFFVYWPETKDFRTLTSAVFFICDFRKTGICPHFMLCFLAKPCKLLITTMLTVPENPSGVAGSLNYIWLKFFIKLMLSAPLYFLTQSTDFWYTGKDFDKYILIYDGRLHFFKYLYFL